MSEERSMDIDEAIAEWRKAYEYVEEMQRKAEHARDLHEDSRRMLRAAVDKLSDIAGVSGTYQNKFYPITGEPGLAIWIHDGDIAVIEFER